MDCVFKKITDFENEKNEWFEQIKNINKLSEKQRVFKDCVENSCIDLSKQHRLLNKLIIDIDNSYVLFKHYKDEFNKCCS